MNIETIVYPKNVSEGESYLDPAKANEIEARLEEDLKTLQNASANMAKCIRNMCSKKIVTGSYNTKFTKLAKNLETRSKGTGNRLKELKSAYDSDTQEYIRNGLMKRLQELEDRIAKLEKTEI